MDHLLCGFLLLKFLSLSGREIFFRSVTRQRHFTESTRLDCLNYWLQFCSKEGITSSVPRMLWTLFFESHHVIYGCGFATRRGHSMRHHNCKYIIYYSQTIFWSTLSHFVIFPLRNFGILVMPRIWFAGVLHQILLVPYFPTIFDFVMFHKQGFLTFLAWWLCARLLRRSCFQMWWREGLRGCPFLQSQPQRTSCRHLHRSERSGQEFQPSGDSVSDMVIKFYSVCFFTFQLSLLASKLTPETVFFSVFAKAF